MKENNHINQEMGKLTEVQDEKNLFDEVALSATTKKQVGREKSKKLITEIERLKSENVLLQDKYLRLAAEFENYKKWLSKEIDNRVRYSVESLVLDILPVLDDLDRSLSLVLVTDENKTFVEGVQLIRSNLIQRLAKQGLEEIDSLGKEFDVEEHEAVMIVDDNNYPANVVAQEHQKGYKLKGKVIRHAKVAVTK